MHISTLIRWTLIPALYLSYEEASFHELDRMLYTSPILFSIGLILYNIFNEGISIRSQDLFYSLFILLGIWDLIYEPRLMMDTCTIWGRFLWITCYRMILITCLLYVCQSLIAFIYFNIHIMSVISAIVVVGTIIWYRK